MPRALAVCRAQAGIPEVQPGGIPNKNGNYSMWIVKIALRRPYTFLVMALLIFLATPIALMRMATDILPEIDIPVISIIYNYNGLSAQEMGQRVTAVNERVLTTTVNDIEHIESQTVAGVAVIKIFFQPGASIQTAIAQVLSLIHI